MRVPDLAGKTVIVAGPGLGLAEIVDAFVANHALVALVASDRELVRGPGRAADNADPPVVAITEDAANPQFWARFVPQVEQRRGPIDVVVAVGPAENRAALRAAVEADMAARRRGIVIEIDATVEPIEPRAGVRHRRIEVGPEPDPKAVAALVLLCASDLLESGELSVALP